VSNGLYTFDTVDLSSMKAIKTLDPQKHGLFSQGFKFQINYRSFINHEDLLIFWCGGIESSGIKLYNSKDLKIINTFASKYVVECMISIDNEHILLG
jgi:hypothetical protein